MVMCMLNRVPEETIESLRKANDVVDVIGEYIQLKKQGRNYIGLCPFHNEKTPSFSVTREKQIFHCFGCGKGGNVMTFLMEMENYSFYETLKFLSQRSDVPLPDTGIKKESSLSEENQNILAAYEWLTKLYNHILRYTKDGREGYQYFTNRGINDESIEEFQLGFAPNVKDFTAEFLKKKGFHQQLLVKAGLLTVQDDGQVIDRFSGKIIFPIRNHLGKTVGFGGRAISNQGGPKYLNSSESELFQKGKLLYNFDLAKRHIRNESEVVLFEGYMDVISAYQAGVKNVIATLGTSLTEHQAKLLRRYADTVILCYDADRPGVEATYKAAVLLRQVGCNVKIADLKDDLDPDSFINMYGAEAFKNVVQASDTFITFYMRYLKKDYNLSLEGDRFQYIENVLKQLAMIESPIEREYYVKELGNEYDLSLDTLKNEIHTKRQKMGRQKDRREQNSYTNNTPDFFQTRKLLPAFQNAERQLIAYMLQDISITEKVQKKIGADFNLDEHKIIVTHLYAHYEEGYPPDVSLFLEKLTDKKLNQLVTEIAMLPVFEDISDKEIEDYLSIIRTESNDVTSIKALRREQKLAEQQNDPIKAAQIAMQIIEIQKQLKDIN